MTADANVASTSPDSFDALLAPLTWEIIEQDFQKTYNTSAKIGEGRHAEQCGAGNGFISRIALVKFDWTEKDERLPETAVLKITGSARLEEMCEAVFKHDAQELKWQAAHVHDSELAFYEMVRDEWKMSPEELRIPKLYTGRPFGKDGLDMGYFAMEHIEGGVLRHMYHNVQPESVVEVLKIVAKFGAISLKRPETVKNFSAEKIREMFETFINVEKIREQMPLVVEAFPDCKEVIDLIMPRLEMLTDYNVQQKIVEEGCPVKMLCHGDLWTANMMWDQDEKGIFHIRTLIDWQVIHTGSPVEDLVRFLNGAVSAKDKKENLSFFLETYYNTLKEECGDEVEVPFTLEKLTESYEKFCPLLAIPMSCLMLPMGELILGSVPEHEREASREVFNDKIRGSLQEAGEYVKKWY